MIRQLRIRKPTNHVESTVPTRSAEEMLGQIDEVRYQRPHRSAGKLLGRGAVRPVNDQRLADDVVARNESPIPAIERVVPVITHSKESIGRNYDLAVLHVIIEHVALQLRLQALGKPRRLAR